MLVEALVAQYIFLTAQAFLYLIDYNMLWYHLCWLSLKVN